MRFPVLSFKGGMMFPAANEGALTTCTKTALENGYFNSLQVIDSDGKAFTVNAAKKRRVVGPFWGYNIFLNQKIRIDLCFAEEVLQLDIDDVRSKVLTALECHQHWDASNDINEIKKEIFIARTVYGIINVIHHAYSRLQRC